jgi:hypothetical protein
MTSPDYEDLPILVIIPDWWFVITKDHLNGAPPPLDTLLIVDWNSISSVDRDLDLKVSHQNTNFLNNYISTALIL